MNGICKLLWVVVFFLLAIFSDGFVLPPKISHSLQLFATSLPDIDSMRVVEIRKELESYGISTKSFLEKKEMVEALKNARTEGKQPVEKGSDEHKVDDTTKKISREERIKEEIEKAKTMKVGDLRKELEGRGISTKSFFEKTEFVKAYAKAVVDGIRNGGGRAAAEEEEYDASYRDVVMQKFDKRDPRLAQSAIIDIRLPK